ncbi:MAG: hypothetical protein WC878_05200 [Candidatus Paceibacterota bacterium]|jgi:hypothetical protein
MENKKEEQNNIGQADSKNQGQLVPTKNAVTVLKSVSDFDEINHEISYAFLCKKAEKLATALYLITGFLSDSEPLKWNIRESGLAVLTDVTSFGNTVVSETSQRVKKIMSDIEKVVSLLEISATAGFMSEMNLAILKEEYLSLVQALGSRKKGGLEEGFVFGREFFSTRGIPRHAANTEEKTEESYKGQIKDNNFQQPVRPSSLSSEGRTEAGFVSSATHPFAGKSGKPISDNNSFVGKTILETKKTAEKTSRREMIIALIKEKKEISIKDITNHFPDCGEKTIQRELAALVTTKVLKKTGDRRWSKYSLA